MKIAIIGTGISGLTSAYLLSKEHSVHVYEAKDYIGGHVYTLPVHLNGTSYEIDTGFIVFNDRTYPNSVNQGFYWWEIDITYWILKILSFLGIIWDLKKVPENILRSSLIA